VSFKDFLGNEPTVRHLRESLAAQRLPHSLILAGPRGSGKYTLAIMLAQAANCLNPTTTDGLPDFCGVCSNCQRIGQALDLDARVDEAIAAREELRDADKRDTRILIQTHPDVLVIPPDPPQLLIKIGQVRVLIRELYRVPAEARRAFSIFTSASFMKEAANSLLKVLEEPPAHATIVLLAENTGELLPTIRSRAGIFRLGAIPTGQIEKLLAERCPEAKPAERALISRLSEGAIGRALGFDLPAYLASRADALVLLRNTIGQAEAPGSPASPGLARGGVEASDLFKVTETYRAGAEGQEKTEGLLRAAGSLLEDLLLLKSETPHLVRNIDLQKELAAMASVVTFDWIESAAGGLRQVESGMRRNLLRSLTLDSFAAQLSQ
jgi:DNA polymerase III subunit delta'